MSESKTTKKTSPKTQESKTKRYLKGEKEVHHDLFRLENKVTKKNVGWGAQPIWEPVEHKHFFHSVNSDGKPQDKSAPSCGHFHYVEVKEVDGELVATCSAPKMMRRNKQGKRVVVDYPNDQHTHDITYMQSEVVKQRVFNEDAIKEISRIQAENSQRMKNPLA